MTTTSISMDIVKRILSFNNTFIYGNGTVAVINKIKKEDDRYELLLNIPKKEYCVVDDLIYVYIFINDTKDYFMTYKNYKIQLQTFEYVKDAVMLIDGVEHEII